MGRHAREDRSANGPGVSLEDGLREDHARATISAIHRPSCGSDLASFGLVVAPSTGPVFRAACHQPVPSGRCDVHLGAVVTVAFDEDRAVRIEWPDGGARWRPLPGLLVDGVHDACRRARPAWGPHGRRALATVLGAGATSAHGCDGVVDLELTVVEDRSSHLIRLSRRSAPFYARHLLGAGVILPAEIDPSHGTVRIDWLSAANGLVARYRPSPAAVLAALASGGLGATSADAPGLRRPPLRRPGAA